MTFERLCRQDVDLRTSRSDACLLNSAGQISVSTWGLRPRLPLLPPSQFQPVLPRSSHRKAESTIMSPSHPRVSTFWRGRHSASSSHQSVRLYPFAFHRVLKFVPACIPMPQQAWNRFVVRGKVMALLCAARYPSGRAARISISVRQSYRAYHPDAWSALCCWVVLELNSLSIWIRL